MQHHPTADAQISIRERVPEPGDDNAAARGIALGVLLGVPMWWAIASTVWWALSSRASRPG